jgi:hypothetical protein
LGNSYLAKVKLDQAKETFEKLKAVHIPANPAKQKAAVDQKLEIVNGLNTQLGNIIKLDSPEEIVSSLAILGEANQHIADSFLAVPVPSNLNEESKKAYMAEIQKIINPFITKADESFKLAVERAWELQAYPPEYQKAYAYMNKKNPQQYYDGGEVPSDVKRMDWMV